MNDIQIKEDKVYADAEKVIAVALGQHKVGSHTDPAAPKQLIEPEVVMISGAPRNLSFSKRVRDGATGDSCENLSVSITPRIDLRAANEGQIREEVYETFKTLLSGDKFKLPDGTTVADAYNWSGKEDGKVPVKLDINTSFSNGTQNNEIHIFLDLPKGVTHSDVVDALAGKNAIEVKTPAEAAPVVGEATAKVAAGREAANDPQARGVA